MGTGGGTGPAEEADPGERQGRGMKRKTAKEILADSFRELAQSIPIDKITVKDIIGNCGYSQATFYRQFRDKYDLIVWSYTQDLEAIIDQIRGDEYTWRQALKSAAGYYRRQRKYLANLLTHTNGYDSFVINMSRIHSKGLQRALDRLAGPDQIDSEARMYAQIYCYGTVMFSCDWILGKYDLSEDELADIDEKALPEALLRDVT